MAAVASRILIDATMTRRGGGFTYLVNLLPRLAALAPERTFRVLARSAALRESLPAAPNLEVVRLPEASFAARMLFSWVGGPNMARRWHADVYFAAGDIAPLVAPCPVIASFRNPNVFTSLDQDWYAFQVFRLGALRQLARLTGRRCARILFVSHDSARWIGASIGLATAKRRVIHHGIDPARFAARMEPMPHPRPYILSVSSIYRYKNFVRLIEAWTLLARRRADTPDLVIVGDDMDTDYSALMRAARDAAGELGKRIRIVGAVPYADIPGWYGGASLFAFPSYLETFGHPLLEAMAADVPVVAADIPVSREVAGDAAIYVPPDDVEALAAALARGLDDAAFRASARAIGRKRVAQFSWDASARAHLKLFDELVTPPVATAAQSE
jgi:glycosyltransferase involved in cell wall biosynthesis